MREEKVCCETGVENWRIGKLRTCQDPGKRKETGEAGRGMEYFLELESG